LVTLVINNNKLKSLAGIEKLVNLRELKIGGNKIKSIARVKKLVNLYYLFIWNIDLVNLELWDDTLVSIDKYNLIKYIGLESKNAWVLTYNYWQIKKYPQHLKQLIFDYYKMYFIKKYKNELIKNKWIEEIYIHSQNRVSF
jgi:Leucine-rich repeat (LRR) protein